ncbi:MAG: ABC transporter permease [Oscillospiraceae bacterium]|nr:ABC transporter permease [Oscillospiraceae bacterium]
MMIVLVVFFTVTGTIVVYNYYLTSNLESRYYIEKERSYTISENFSDIDNQLETLLKEHRSDIQRIFVTFRNNNDTILSDYFGESSMLFKVQLGRFFDDTAANQILIPTNTPNGADYIGQTYRIEDEEFQVIGISSIDAYEIPYQTLKVKERIGQVVVVVVHNLKEDSKKMLVNNIKRIFQTEQIEIPIPPINGALSVDYIIFFSIILLGILNLSYIYISIMEKRKKQQAIFHILGCSRPKLIGLYLSEIFIIVTVSFFLCALFSKFVLFNIFHAFDEFYYHVINVKQYFFLYVGYTSPILFVLLYQLVHFFRKTPFELKRK